MPKRSKKNQKTNTKLQELVTVTCTTNWEQAKNYETLLKNNDIPAMTKEQDDQSTDAKNIAVLVPEYFLDEAHVIIESQDAYDDFYDLTIGNEDDEDSDFDSDLFDDEF